MARDHRAMKHRDFKKCICDRGVMHTNMPTFYRLQFTRMFIDARAVQRAQGIEQFFGGGQAGAVLGNVMGTDDDLAVPVGETIDVLLCEQCAMDFKLSTPELIEKAFADKEAK